MEVKRVRRAFWTGLKEQQKPDVKRVRRAIRTGLKEQQKPDVKRVRRAFWTGVKEQQKPDLERVRRAIWTGLKEQQKPEVERVRKVIWTGLQLRLRQWKAAKKKITCEVRTDCRKAVQNMPSWNQKSSQCQREQKEANKEATEARKTKQKRSV